MKTETLRKDLNKFKADFDRTYNKMLQRLDALEKAEQQVHSFAEKDRIWKRTFGNGHGILKQNWNQAVRQLLPPSQRLNPRQHKVVMDVCGKLVASGITDIRKLLSTPSTDIAKILGNGEGMRLIHIALTHHDLKTEVPENWYDSPSSLQLHNEDVDERQAQLATRK